MSEPVDPVIATGFNIVGDENGLVLFFNRPVFTPMPDGTMEKTFVVDTGAAMSWTLMVSLHKALSGIIDQRDAAPVPGGTSGTADVERPN